MTGEALEQHCGGRTPGPAQFSGPVKCSGSGRPRSLPLTDGMQESELTSEHPFVDETAA